MILHAIFKTRVPTSFSTRRSSDFWWGYAAVLAVLGVSIWAQTLAPSGVGLPQIVGPVFGAAVAVGPRPRARGLDRKSTRLNSSHVAISYSGFCMSKKNKDI